LGPGVSWPLPPANFPLCRFGSPRAPDHTMGLPVRLREPSPHSQGSLGDGRGTGASDTRSQRQLGVDGQQGV
jgi:hypothetical protein